MALILIIEDDQQIRELLKLRLEKDHLVLEAATGELALGICKRVKPNLTILDIHLNSGISGKEVCKILAETPMLAGMPILIVSGYDDRQAISDVMRAGLGSTIHFLAKPFSSHELNDIVKKLLEKESQKLGRLLVGASETEIINAVKEAYETGHSQKILRALRQGIREAVQSEG